MTTQELFDKAYHGNLSKLDMYNMIEELTDGFEESRFRMLCDEFDFYTSVAQENWGTQLSSEEIEERISELKEQGKEIPVIADRKYYLNKPIFWSSGQFNQSKDYVMPKKLIEEISEAIKSLSKLDMFSLSKVDKYSFIFSLSDAIADGVEREQIISEQALIDADEIGQDRMNQKIIEIVSRDLFNKQKNERQFNQSKYDVTIKILEEIKEYQKSAIDVERLMDRSGLHFSGLYKLRRVLVKIKKEHFDSKSEEARSVQPIKWLKSEEALRQLIDALKEHGLIESRETDDIIEHFEVSGREAKQAELEPINWIGKATMLVYMIEKLAGIKKIISVNDVWQDTIYSHFLIDGNVPKDHMRQSASKYKSNKSGKPKNAEIIDSIIDNMPAK